MRVGRRYGLSSAQKTEIWRRWKAGESLHEIGGVFGNLLPLTVLSFGMRVRRSIFLA